MVSTKLDILGIEVDNLTMSQAVSALVELHRARRGGKVNFLNAHCANVAVSDRAYRQALARSDYVFADGSGVRIASAMMGDRVVDNVNGTDMAPLLFSALAKEGARVFFLGAGPGVARKAAANTAAKHGNGIVAGFAHGYRSADDWDRLVDELVAAAPDFVLVSLGVPGQELWIEKYAGRFKHTVFLGVGGLIDFLAHRIPRAPAWLRRMGMEWVYRLYQEPGRMWRRYLVGNLVFLARSALYAYSKSFREPGSRCRQSARTHGAGGSIQKGI